MDMATRIDYGNTSIMEHRHRQIAATANKISLPKKQIPSNLADLFKEYVK